MDLTFALDIGTRSIIGMVGVLEDDKVHILAIEKEEHRNRAMVDGQIENIDQVAKVARLVKERLEEQTDCQLKKVHVAAAGRALRTQSAVYELELSEIKTIDEETIRTLEAGAIGAAEEEFAEDKEEDRQFYLAGYSVRQYYLDHYPISSLKDHRGKVLSAEVIATFLPREVVESLYAAMGKAGLEVGSLTLEPIASMNAAIPQNLRLLNLALVDIGAGTSDIAVAKDGSVFGYTMATVAGDEVTENLMKTYLVDFATAESMKFQLENGNSLTYRDVLGFEHSVSGKELMESAQPVIQSLCRQIAEKVTEINQTAPSAVFLVGGGSKMAKVREYVAECLNMDLNRVALGGNNFSSSAFSDHCDLNDPEYSTPLGIVISAALNLISDSFQITLNGERAKLFRNGKLTVLDVLMMNGYTYKDLMGRSGRSLSYYLDGERVTLRGVVATSAQMMLNGREAGLTEFVRAGDHIDFVPACSGEDRTITLGEAASIEKRGIVYFGDTEIPIGSFAKINGELAPEDTPVKNGDRLETLHIETVREAAKYAGAEGICAVNGDLVSPDSLLSDKDQLGEADIGEEYAEMLRQGSSGRDAAVRPAVLSSSGRLELTLNGERISLPPREDGSPYLLIHLLPGLELDLADSGGALVLKVNGEEAGFQTELKSGNFVDIYWSGTAEEWNK